MPLRKLLWPMFYSLIAVAAAPVPADILVNDEFVVDGDLLGTTPSPGPGGVWEVNNQSSMGINAIQISGGEVILVQDGAVSGEDGHSDFEPRSATDITYARFDVRLPSSANGDLINVNEDGNYFALLRQAGNQGFRARTGVVVPSAGGDFGLAISANSSNLGPDGATWPSDLSFDTNYRVVISYDAATGGSQLWLDPVDQASASIIDPVGTASDIIQGFSLRQSGDYEGSQVVDNVVVATTFEEALNGAGGGLACDFDGDGLCSGNDVDQLVAELASMGTNLLFDVNGDNVVDQSDLTEWLALAGAENLASGNSYLVGDANLDGSVDVTDFNAWNGTKFTNMPAWTMGDFNADGSVDVSDFNAWNTNKFTSADGVAVVPEPAAWVLTLGGFMAWLKFRRPRLQVHL